MTAEREEPQLQVRDGGGGMHWRVSDGFFFFSCQHTTIKAPARKGSFPWGGGGSSWEQEHLRIMLIIKKKKVLWHWSESI